MSRVHSSQLTVNRKSQNATAVNRKPPTPNRPGQILIIAIIFMTVILILSASLFSRVANYVRFGANDIMGDQANTLAEAGIERTLWKLNTTAGACDSSCTQEQTIGTTGTFEVTITNKSSILKTITATGYVPNKANQRAKRTIKTDTYVSADVVVFNYALQVGTGGLNMSGSSTTIIGNVYSNGNITGSGGTTINGEAWAHGTIGNPPTANCSQPPCKHPGSPLSQMPIEDPPTWYDQWKTAATNGGPPNSNCNYSGGSHLLGPIKCSGDLSMSGGATVIVTGPIYVTGNIALSGGSILKLDESFGSDETVVITDGTISLSGGSSMQSTSANPKGYILLATTSTSSSALSISGGTQSSIFYALDGDASVSGGVELIALVAKTINMSGNSVLTYEQGLASSQFSGGPGGGWTVKKGTYRFTQ